MLFSNLSSAHTRTLQTKINWQNLEKSGLKYAESFGTCRGYLKGRKMRVLVIEDDPSIRETLGMVLEAYEHQPDLVCSGERALDYLGNQWPDVMLLDLTLEGM